jgi:protease I
MPLSYPKGPKTMGKLDGKRIAILTANEGVEQVELTEPWQALREAGAATELISLEEGEVQAFNHLDKADTFEVEKVVGEVHVEDYAGLLLPGGVANPDALRMDKGAVQLVADFFRAGKPVAAICHAPWMLVEATAVSGRRLTSWPSLRTDIRNAGGEWVDEEVVVDGGLVTSRKPDDLPAFIEKMLEEFCEGEHTEQAERFRKENVAQRS